MTDLPQVPSHAEDGRPPAAEGGGHDGGLRVVIAAFAINVVIAIIKFIVAGTTHSTAMLAEAFHSLADTGNQLFLLLGMRLAARPADEDHPFGHAGERYFWAFMAALSIFAVGGALSIYEGVAKVAGTHHAELANPRWAFVVLGASILLETWSFVVAMREFRRESRGRGWRRTVEEARDPTVLTVLFEDAAALVGLLFALAGVALATVTGNPIWDGLASVMVGLVLVSVAWFLAARTKSLLLGRSVPVAERSRIEEIARAGRDVLRVIHIRTVHFGPNQVMCGLKLSFTRTLDIPTLEQRINELEARLRTELPHLVRIYVEPGFDEHAAAPAP